MRIPINPIEIKKGKVTFNLSCSKRNDNWLLASKNNKMKDGLMYIDVIEENKK